MIVIGYGLIVMKGVVQEVLLFVEGKKDIRITQYSYPQEDLCLIAVLCGNERDYSIGLGI